VKFAGAACAEDWVGGWSHRRYLVGQFPHERIPEDKISLSTFTPRITSTARQIGGFYEELLTL